MAARSPILNTGRVNPGRAVAAAFAMFALCVQDVHGQAVLTMSGPARCATCSIRLTPLAPMGRNSDPVLLDLNSELDFDSRGRFFAAPVATAGVIAVFDSLGKQTGTFGRSGSGPGELDEPSRIVVGPGDTLRVLESGTRMSVFGPDLAFVRTSRLPAYGHPVLFLPSGILVGAEAEGQLWIGREGGQVERRVHTLSPPADRLGALRILAPSRDPARFWVGRPTAYRLEQRNIRGELVQAISREVPWFAEWTATVNDLIAASEGQAKLPPYIMGMWEEDPRHLWVFMKVASTSWRAAPPGGKLSPAAYDQIIDLMVEVLDTVDGAVVFSGRLPGNYMGNWGRGLLYRISEDQDGIITFSPFRVSLQTR